MKSGRNKKSIWLSLICAVALTGIGCCAEVNAQSALEIYKEAGDRYNQKQFAEAAVVYEKLLAQGYKSAEVYYNLANCYFKTDSIGKCILNYERALKLSPDDEDAAHNLRLANLRTVDKIEPVPQLGIIMWWNRFLKSFSSAKWAIFSLIVLWAAFFLAAAGQLTGRGRLAFSVAAFLMLVSILFFSFAAIQRDHETSASWGILMSTSTNVKSAPDNNAGDLFLIHQGTKMQMLDRVGEWNKIRLADGKVGWIMQGMAERI